MECTNVEWHLGGASLEDEIVCPVCGLVRDPQELNLVQDSGEPHRGQFLFSGSYAYFSHTNRLDAKLSKRLGVKTPEDRWRLKEKNFETSVTTFCRQVKHPSEAAAVIQFLRSRWKETGKKDHRKRGHGLFLQTVAALYLLMRFRKGSTRLFGEFLLQCGLYSTKIGETRAFAEVSARRERELRTEAEIQTALRPQKGDGTQTSDEEEDGQRQGGRRKEDVLESSSASSSASSSSSSSSCAAVAPPPSDQIFPCTLASEEASVKKAGSEAGGDAKRKRRKILEAPPENKREGKGEDCRGVSKADDAEEKRLVDADPENRMMSTSLAVSSSVAVALPPGELSTQLSSPRPEGDKRDHGEANGDSSGGEWSQESEGGGRKRKRKERDKAAREYNPLEDWTLQDAAGVEKFVRVLFSSADALASAVVRLRPLTEYEVMRGRFQEDSTKLWEHVRTTREGVSRGEVGRRVDTRQQQQQLGNMEGTASTLSVAETVASLGTRLLDLYVAFAETPLDHCLSGEEGRGRSEPDREREREAAERDERGEEEGGEEDRGDMGCVNTTTLASQTRGQAGKLVSGACLYYAMLLEALELIKYSPRVGAGGSSSTVTPEQINAMARRALEWADNAAAVVGRGSSSGVSRRRQTLLELYMGILGLAGEGETAGVEEKEMGANSAAASCCSGGIAGSLTSQVSGKKKKDVEGGRNVSSSRQERPVRGGRKKAKDENLRPLLYLALMVAPPETRSVTKLQERARTLRLTKYRSRSRVVQRKAQGSGLSSDALSEVSQGRPEEAGLKDREKSCGREANGADEQPSDTQRRRSGQKMITERGGVKGPENLSGDPARKNEEDSDSHLDEGEEERLIALLEETADCEDLLMCE
uniref:Uncharacterized protein n=1 Tax=Chromera velia CCMP2878 TaxID=1169474 RepID=A0A0G4HER7_9ALVE|eukprot:Cvel_6586.t1-p1 / transcript=Cvel_6586.t1 / gene=Cvel_6586 / organism=Chromera_velia_CCMP2878 / gene_product=hypothetical protein / transcript_product=hypothetical protein / location=Cvel_scaffold325:22400-27202(+) / protein_length=873 / sequence_SO=supercontig / SO=protein_coding / is_pseudo=false